MRHSVPRRPMIAAVALATLLAGALAAPAFAAGGSRESIEPTQPQEEVDPAVLAKQHYNRGLGHRDRAWKLEEELAEATADKQIKKLEKKIRSSYRSAVREFEQAVRNDGQLYPAWSSLGYAQRKLGAFDLSLEAYDRALAIEPRYAEAVEYRAEAYLGLGRLEPAKEAYLELFAGAREHADTLLVAMRKWVDARTAAPGDLDAETLAAFEAWVAEREKIASQTARLGAPSRSGW